VVHPLLVVELLLQASVGALAGQVLEPTPG
jgi:hypothetical protein